MEFVKIRLDRKQNSIIPEFNYAILQAYDFVNYGDAMAVLCRWAVQTSGEILSQALI